MKRTSGSLASLGGSPSLSGGAIRFAIGTESARAIFSRVRVWIAPVRSARMIVDSVTPARIARSSRDHPEALRRSATRDMGLSDGSPELRSPVRSPSPEGFGDQATGWGPFKATARRRKLTILLGERVTKPGELLTNRSEERRVRKE